ncbi:peroxiredoxin family protein [Niabella aurantiaca]|uniref:peroxiredoxin family protein n=1 Tax=Niabella aurantiaca TaxID=379900 RepID=UPI000380750D|nr:TlpA disulfide reductase family protein [Niabella aurantiaca]
MLSKFATAKNLQFEETKEAKSLFNTDTTSLYGRYTFFFNEQGTIKNADVTTRTALYKNRIVVTDSAMYFYDLEDRTYTRKPGSGGYSGTISGISALLSTAKRLLADKPGCISLRKDTVIRQKAYYVVLVNSFDSVIDGRRNFTDQTLIIDKKTYLPLMQLYVASGWGQKPGITEPTFIDVYEKAVYTNIRINKLSTNHLSGLAVLKGFKPYVSKALLSEHTPAPAWSGITVEGASVSSESSLGKIVLLYLSGIGCPAAQASIRTVNNITGKYKTRPFTVFGIYADGRKSLETYIQRNAISYPVIFDGQEIKKKFHAPGTPYFYILDKAGKVAYAQTGWNPETEKTLTEKIRGLLNTP